MAAKRVWLAGLCLFLTVVFLGLGVWQVQRLQWKLDLISQVETRASAAPVPTPAPDDAAQVGQAYQAVRAEGVFDHGAETLVQAVTAIGPGYWVVTPLRTERGFTVLVNRGFVRADSSAARDWSRPEGRQTVTGLLRLTEPKGGFLRANDPAGDRWRSRDVAAIAAKRDVSGPIAPYFIDAGAGAAGAWPRGGLTVIRFTNHHLVYALTWFGLAGLAIFGAWRLRRDRLKPGPEGA